MKDLIAYLNRAVYSLECCDDATTYAEAQKIRGWIAALARPEESKHSAADIAVATNVLSPTAHIYSWKAAAEQLAGAVLRAPQQRSETK